MNTQSADEQKREIRRHRETGQDDETVKKVYRNPALVEYGNIVEITRASSLGGMPDGGSMLLMMMSM